MLSETLSKTDVLNYPLFALIVFMAVFAIVVIRVMTSGRKNDRMDAMSQLPLADDEAPPTHPKAGSH